MPTKQKKRRKKRSVAGRRPDWRPKLPEPPPLPSPEQVTCEDLLVGTGRWPEKILVDVGVELHAGRKAEPLDDDGLSYDDRVGVQYRPFDIETCGFRISAVPRRIGVREVAGYADDSCRSCHGRGYQSIERTAQVGVDPAGNKQMEVLRYEQSCDCADKRYKKKHPCFLIDSQLGEWIALDNLAIIRAEDIGDDKGRDTA